MTKIQSLSSKNRSFIISAITTGGIIEWYEIFLFIHWNELFKHLFFKDHPDLAIYNTLFIFFVGFIGRPVGAIFFGNIGDRLGRKLAFTGSIALMIFPSILIGCLGWGVFPKSGIPVTIFLCCLRFIQGMAAGGELPGAMCYLSECAPKSEKSHISSFSFLGPQIGVLISQLETYLFSTKFSNEFIETFGWRISFIVGGVIAFLALLFRTKLEESPDFQTLKAKALTSHKPIADAVSYWKKLLGGFLSTILAAVGFYMFAVFIEVYFHDVFNINKTDNLLISMAMMALSTATLTRH